MNILVVGAGVVGESLAEQLSLEGHRVAVVDKNRRKVNELLEKMDVLAVRGNAGAPSVLQRAGIKTAEMVIAVTDVDEVNLVVGMLAGRMGVEHRIVRIRNEEYLQDTCVLSLKDLGLDHVINPDPAIVNALVKMIEIPGSSDFATLAGGQVLMLGFDIAEDSPMAGRTLQELREIGDLDAFLILYLTRGDQVVVPRGHDKVQPGDNVHLLVSADTVQFVPPMVHKRPEAVNSVIITGASRVGVSLAEAIQGKVETVFLIEPDEEAAEDAASRLRDTTVLQGDETNLAVLEEASIDHCDLFCAVSDDDQRNMLASLLAKKHSKTHAAVLVHQPEYVPVLDSLGVEIVLNPRLVTVGEILMHVRRGHIHSVTRLAESRAEIIEMEVPADSPATKSKVRELKFPNDALIGAIIRNGVMNIPTGESQIQPSDIVVVFALPDAIPRIEKLFTRRKWF
jgi:trk system potassium uptake protein TrkA